ncbi:protein fam177a1 [Plakobranchus ocellatus]|uniref:Protein fam177a1 n=1 Tax=Plakobranchus ocellatus TaxID=259542 RepID=A0AAV3YKI6_9GAST|nr:protein fam177a1 [Plakobranchus ocellatus]
MEALDLSNLTKLVGSQDDVIQSNWDLISERDLAMAVGVDNATTSFEVELSTSTKSKVPKKILHFSDGILEEYSSDDSDDSEDIVVKVDPSSLTWGPWCLYYMSGAARRTLSAADYCGERLASLLGITTPKYQYAINEHNRIQKEIEMERIRHMKLKEETDGISSIDVKIVEGRKTKESVALTDRSSKDDAEKY